MVSVMAFGGFSALIRIQLGHQDGLLLGGQPLRLLGPVSQDKGHGAAEEEGGNPLENEEPLPVPRAVPALRYVENPAGERAANDARHRDGGHEQRDDAGAMLTRVPVGEVEDDAGKETGLGDA